MASFVKWHTSFASSNVTARATSHRAAGRWTTNLDRGAGAVAQIAARDAHSAVRVGLHGIEREAVGDGPVENLERM